MKRLEQLVLTKKVNARGDTIDDTGKIVVPVTEKVGKRYQGSVSNRSAIPKKQVQVKEQMTKEEMELEYLNELDTEIQNIKKQERK